MNVEIGLFMGACMFAAYRWGRFVEHKAFTNTMNELFSKMNSDMDGAVVQWFTKNIKQQGEAQ
jgi:hypothetical protein